MPTLSLLVNVIDDEALILQYSVSSKLTSNQQ
jgi:hypothetical protein